MVGTPTDSSPGAIARSYLASFSTREPLHIAAHVAADFINEHTSALGSGCVGHDAYLARLPNFLADMADLHYEVEELVIEGPVVVAFYTMTANWQGGASIRVRGVQHLLIRDGLIARRTDYWDSKVFLDQVTAFNEDPTPR